jgi:hypothetical protein
MLFSWHMYSVGSPSTIQVADTSTEGATGVAVGPRTAPPLLPRGWFVEAIRLQRIGVRPTLHHVNPTEPALSTGPGQIRLTERFRAKPAFYEERRRIEILANPLQRRLVLLMIGSGNDRRSSA